MSKNPFPDYRPKSTPDTIHDYIGTWTAKSGKKPADVLDKIPENKLEKLKNTIDLFAKFKKEASKQPGKFVQGNMILGAPPQEYVPSETELIVSELGFALKTIISTTPPTKLKAYLKANNIKPQEIAFIPILISHADVMGSGRFFYAEKGKEIRIKM